MKFGSITRCIETTNLSVGRLALVGMALFTGAAFVLIYTKCSDTQFSIISSALNNVTF